MGAPGRGGKGAGAHRQEDVGVARGQEVGGLARAWRPHQGQETGPGSVAKRDLYEHREGVLERGERAREKLRQLEGCRPRHHPSSPQRWQGGGASQGQ